MNRKPDVSFFRRKAVAADWPPSKLNVAEPGADSQTEGLLGTTRPSTPMFDAAFIPEALSSTLAPLGRLCTASRSHHRRPKVVSGGQRHADILQRLAATEPSAFRGGSPNAGTRTRVPPPPPAAAPAPAPAALASGDPARQATAEGAAAWANSPKPSDAPPGERKEGTQCPAPTEAHGATTAQKSGSSVSAASLPEEDLARASSAFPYRGGSAHRAREERRLSGTRLRSLSPSRAASPAPLREAQQRALEQGTGSRNDDPTHIDIDRYLSTGGSHGFSRQDSGVLLPAGLRMPMVQRSPVGPGGSLVDTRAVSVSSGQEAPGRGSTPSAVAQIGLPEALEAVVLPRSPLRSPLRMKSKSPQPPQALSYSRPRGLPALQPGVPQPSSGHMSPASFSPPAFDLRRGAGEVWLETPAEAARAESLQAHAASARALASLKAGSLSRAASGGTLKVAERRVERSGARLRASASEPRLRPVGEHGFSQAPRKSVAARFPLQRTLAEELAALETPTGAVPLPFDTPLSGMASFKEVPRTKPGATASPSAARATAELRAAAATEPKSGRARELFERALALSMLSSIPWLVDSPVANLQQLCARSHLITARRYASLGHEGQPRGGPAGGACYLVLSGSVRFTSSAFNLDTELRAGACFGESALVGEVLSAETVGALENTRLLQVRARDLEASGIDVTELHRLWVVKTLQTLPLFRNLNVGRNLAPLSRLMQLVRAPAGEVLLEYGAAADSLLLLSEGRVVFSRPVESLLQVFRRVAKKTVAHHTTPQRRPKQNSALYEAWEHGLGGRAAEAAKRGDSALVPPDEEQVGECNAQNAERPWFGELATEQGRQRRAARATCSEACKLLVVHKKDFKAFFAACPGLKGAFACAKKPEPAAAASRPHGHRDADLEDDPHRATAARFGVTLEATHTVLDFNFAHPPARRHAIVHSSSLRMVRLHEMEGPPPRQRADKDAGAGARNPLLAPSGLPKKEWDRTFDGRNGAMASPSPTMFAARPDSPPRMMGNARAGSPGLGGPVVVAPVAKRAW